MEILKQATYGRNELRIQQREFLFRGFIQVEKVSLSHRLFNQNHYTPVIHRELIQRPEAAGVLLYDEKKHNPDWYADAGPDLPAGNRLFHGQAIRNDSCSGDCLSVKSETSFSDLS